jgi:hypothetical protein
MLYSFGSSGGDIQAALEVREEAFIHGVTRADTTYGDTVETQKVTFDGSDSFVQRRAQKT